MEPGHPQATPIPGIWGFRFPQPDSGSAVAARLQAGVVAQVKHCAAGWCRVTGNGFDGWVEQQRLWGVYKDEKVE